MCYINTYEVTRVWCGPEEGGRYCTVRDPMGCVRIRGGVHSDRARHAFNLHAERHGMTPRGHYGKRRPGYWRSAGQIDHELCLLEAGPAQPTNDYQPYS